MSSIWTVAHKRNRKTLREEIRQTKPFASPAQEAILGLYRTADLLQRTFAQIVEPRDISLQQYNVLRILRGAGKQGTPTLDIADRMIEKTPGITNWRPSSWSGANVAPTIAARFSAGSPRADCNCWPTSISHSPAPEKK